MAIEANVLGSVQQQSSIKKKLEAIANSKRVQNFNKSISGSLTELLVELAKCIGSAGSKYADALIETWKKVPSKSLKMKESYCLGWVCDVLEATPGIGRRIFDVNTATMAWNMYALTGKQHKEREIPTGAIVFGKAAPGTDGDLGHVGICIKGYDQTENVNSMIIVDDYWPRGVGTQSFATWEGIYSYRGFYLVEEL